MYLAYSQYVLSAFADISSSLSTFGAAISILCLIFVVDVIYVAGCSSAAATVLRPLHALCFVFIAGLSSSNMDVKAFCMQIYNPGHLDGGSTQDYECWRKWESSAVL
jgi:hypothetical protein